MSKNVFTVRADPETTERIDKLAKAVDRSRNWVVNEALNEYLDAQAWQIKAIQDGVESADKGELSPHEDVMAGLRRKIDRAGQP